jgi:C-1 hydroxylase
MTPAEHKNLCLQMVAGWNRWDLNGIIEHWAPHVVHYWQGAPVEKSFMIKQMETGLNAFPDLHLDVRSIIAEDDLVTLRITVTGTHKGEFAGIAPTGKQVTWDMVEELRFADGKVVERWDVVNILPVLQSIGSIPVGA